MRLVRYLSKSFSNGQTGLHNLHLDIRALGDKMKFTDKFEFQILCVSGSLVEIKTLERLLIIYENRYNNEVGYDLSINNYYNKIVGDLYDYISGNFKHFHPFWRDIPPDRLELAIKQCVSWKEYLRRFFSVEGLSTIMNRAVSYGFTLKGTGSIRDMRAFFTKSIIEEGVLKDLEPSEIVNLLIYRGLTFLNNLSETAKNRRQWLNKICNFIWKVDIENLGYKYVTVSRVRKLILFNELLKLARNPKINTFYKAERELREKGVILRPPNQPHNKGELYTLMKNLPLDEPFYYKEEQNKILEPIFADYLKQDNPELSVSDIAELLGLDRVKDKTFVINLITRIFDKKEGIKKKRNIGEIRQFLRK